MRTRRRLAALATTGAVTLTLLGAPAAADVTAGDLFISEYVEGSSNNKAIELYNGTGAPVDLAGGDYRLRVHFNGSTSSTAFPLTGTVAAGDVFVFASASAGAAILAEADQTTGTGLFNGDDAIVLVKGETVLDSIGQVGVDPGSEWGSGLLSTADNTLRRLPTVAAGDTDPADAVDLAAQWEGFPADTFDDLGRHTFSGGGPVDRPATLTCAPLTVSEGESGSTQVTATDPDDTIVDLAVTAVSPATGSISRTGFTPADQTGGTATATITAAADLPAGSYAVTVTATDAEGATATCTLPVKVAGVLTVGQVQGPTTDDESPLADRSPLAPASGNGSSSEYHDVRGVITQKTLARTSAGAAQHGFFLQSRLGATDGDPASSDGIFVFMGGFTSLIGGYTPTVGDEVVLRARVSEYYNMTQLSGASLVRKLASGLDVDTVVEVTDAVPPAELADAERFWERHEGARLRVRAGSGAVSGRAVFASTADSELWLVDRDDPLLERTDAYARRVFRDTHPLDNDPSRGFDDGNGQRIMLGSMGVKATAGDSATLLPPVRTFDTLTTDAVGGLYYSFEKFGIQVESAEFTAGADPSANHPPQPAKRSQEIAIAAYNVENLYDYRDDPFDGCDFTGNSGCTGVSPPFDYVPASEAAYNEQLGNLADQIVTDLHAPDLILVQEAEDQDICTVVDGAMSCGTTDNADGAPDTLQELALAVTAAGGPAYAAAYDRTGADARGITSAFMYRTDRISLAEAVASDAVLGSEPAVQYRAAGLPVNADVQNPKSLNAHAARRRGPLHRHRRAERLHPRPAGRQVHRGGGAGRPRALHALGGQQPLLLRTGQPGRTAAGTGRVRRGDRRRHRGRRRSRPGGLRRGPERLPPPRRPDRHRREPDPVGSARAALRRRAAQPLGRPAGRRAVGGVLVQLRGARPDARPPLRQRRAARRPDRDAGGAHQRRLAGEPRRGRVARFQRPRPAGGPVPLPGVAERRRRHGGRGRQGHHAADLHRHGLPAAVTAGADLRGRGQRHRQAGSRLRPVRRLPHAPGRRDDGRVHRAGAR